MWLVRNEVELLYCNIETRVRRLREVEMLEYTYYVRLRNLLPNSIPWEGSVYILFTKNIRHWRRASVFMSSAVSGEKCCHSPREALERHSPGALPSPFFPKSNYSNGKLQLLVACIRPQNGYASDE